MAISVDIRSTVKKNKLPILLAIIAIMIPVIIQNSYLIYVMTIAFIFSVSAIGWNICYGYAGLLSFGHSAFFGVSAYVCVYLFKLFFITPWIGIFAGAAVATGLGIALAAATAKARGFYFSLATSAFPNILLILFTWFYEFTGGSYGLTVPYVGESFLYLQFTSKIPYYYITFAFLIAALLGLRKMDTSRLGNYLKAIGTDEDAANSIGINVFRMRLYGMGISAFLAGISGSLYANLIHFIDPYEAFGWTMNIYFILSTMVGGLGTIVGPAFGSFILTPVSEFLKLTLEQRFGSRFVGAHFVIYGVLLMILIVFMPKGIYPEVKKRLRK